MPHGAIMTPFGGFVAVMLVPWVVGRTAVAVHDASVIWHRVRDWRRARAQDRLLVGYRVAGAPFRGAVSHG